MIEKITTAKNQYALGKRYAFDACHLKTASLSKEEFKKRPQRFEVINDLLTFLGNSDSIYLEIGVRNPEINFNKVISKTKYGVDPGIEFRLNPVDFKMTSDSFFTELQKGHILNTTIRFDVIFLDGLHLADQTARDIQHSLMFIKDNGFIVIHDCNPPSEYHAREDYYYRLSPAEHYWNGTVWKAFYKCRFDTSLACCCIDSDWGIGIISKTKYFDSLKTDSNPFLEFSTFEKYRQENLNLMSYEKFKNTISSYHANCRKS